MDHENFASFASFASSQTYDLTPRDCYFVALHVANLVVVAENAGVSEAIRRRLRAFLDQAIAEFDAACEAANTLDERIKP